MQADDTTVAPGFCRCGCGRRTPIARQTYTDLGVVAGEPTPYARGHNRHTLSRTNRIERRGDHAVLFVLRRSGEETEVLFDAADVELVSAYRWTIIRSKPGQYYASGIPWGAPHRTPGVLMHRLLADAPPEVLVDHQDGNRLDNRRRNIRHATYSGNGANRGRDRDNTSGFKGVSWDKKRGKWQAGIGNGHGKRRALGRYDTPEEAARAYDRAAREQFGEFARVNFPEEAA